jgi:predicted amidophosphoribosyltransferase
MLNCGICGAPDPTGRGCEKHDLGPELICPSCQSGNEMWPDGGIATCPDCGHEWEVVGDE